MDGWVYGQVGGWWVGGKWLAGWMGGWVHGWIGGWVDMGVSGWITRLMDDWVGGWMGGCLARFLDGWVDGWMNEQMMGGGVGRCWMDGWIIYMTDHFILPYQYPSELVPFCTLIKNLKMYLW